MKRGAVQRGAVQRGAVQRGAVQRIAMWSGPRNISTAMMRAFENRADTVVVDEPLYGYYLRTTGLRHPGGTDVIAAMDCDWRSVTQGLVHQLPGNQNSAECSVYYQKHMTQHILPAIDLAFTESLVNCFLVRDPGYMIASYAKIRPDFRLEELGVNQQWEIFQRSADISGTAPPVLDAARILADPRGCLSALCAQIGIEFSGQMLQWPRGPRDSDGVWAPHWYESVEDSVGFGEPRTQELVIPQKYLPMVEQARALYDKLMQYHLQVLE